MRSCLLQVAPGASAPGARFLALIAILALSTTSSADDAGQRDPYEYFFIQTFGDLPEEMEVARKQGKLGMLLFFEADSCGYCQHMRETVLNQPRVQDWYRERFINVSIDIHGDVELTDFDGITLPSKVFAEHRRIYMTPVVSFLDLNGTEIYRHLGMVKTPEEFLLMGEYVEGGHYFDTEFKVFAESRGLDEADGILVTPAEESE